MSLPLQATDPRREPIVGIHNGEAFADSRHVAAYFGKDHKRVLQTIRELHCSDEFRRHNFVPFKINDLTGESTSHVEMTKSGFAFLVMGFTGADAGRFKEAYIVRFDAMEKELRASASVSVAELEAQVLRAVGGVVKGVTNKAIEAHLAPINHAIATLAARVEEATASYDPSAGFTTDYAPMCSFINPLVPNSRRRAVLVRSASRRCTRWLIARSLGSKIKISRESSRHLFHIDAAAEWMEAEGKILIRDHNDRIAGQTVMHFPRVPKSQPKPPTDGGLL